MEVRRNGGSPPGLVPLSRVLDKTLEQLQSTVSAGHAGDAILFSGNRHESVPRALFLDVRLTPLERNAWQVFRMQLNADGITVFPTYGKLRPFLASVPCAGPASDETVARALTLLRLTRWLTLARHLRCPKTGRIQGNLYVLHDEPLSPYEAIQLDPHYLMLVSSALTHASKAIQRVGCHTLKEITSDPLLSGRVLPSRLQILTQRLAKEDWAEMSFDGPTSDSEDGNNAEDGAKPLKGEALRNPKQDRTVRTDPIYKEVRTVLRARDEAPLRLPERFARLRAEQQTGALAALAQVEVELRQPVIDEWAARCHSSKIRNPAGYLFGIIQKAMRGEFHAWAGQCGPPRSESAAAPIAADPSITATRDRRESADWHIARIRAMPRE
jgi:hypothetical protein